MARNVEDAIRKATQAKTVFGSRNMDPNREYTYVRYDETYDPHGDNLRHFLDNGWTIDYSEESVKDDRPNSPSHNKEDKLRKSPVTVDGKGMCKYIRVSKDKKTLEKDRNKRVEKEKADFVRKAGRSKATGRNGLSITGHELNETNINHTSED